MCCQSFDATWRKAQTYSSQLPCQDLDAKIACSCKKYHSSTIKEKRNWGEWKHHLHAVTDMMFPMPPPDVQAFLPRGFHLTEESHIPFHPPSLNGIAAIQLSPSSPSHNSEAACKHKRKSTAQHTLECWSLLSARSNTCLDHKCPLGHMSRFLSERSQSTGMQGMIHA